MELGIGEILVVLVIVLLLFGPTKLPQLGESLGRGIRNFKKAVGGQEDERPPGGAAPNEPPALPEGSRVSPQVGTPREEAFSPTRR